MLKAFTCLVLEKCCIAGENFNAVCDVEMLVPEIMKILPRKTRGIAPARFSDNVEAGPSSTPLAGPFFQKIVRRNMHKAPLVRGVVVHLVVGRGVGKEPEGCLVVKTEEKFEAEAASSKYDEEGAEQKTVEKEVGKEPSVHSNPGQAFGQTSQQERSV